jgi:hypothetical protein
MPYELKGKRIAFLVANEGFEQVELTEPPAFNAKIVEEFAEGVHSEQAEKTTPS